VVLVLLAVVSCMSMGRSESAAGYAYAADDEMNYAPVAPEAERGPSPTPSAAQSGLESLAAGEAAAATSKSLADTTAETTGGTAESQEEPSTTRLRVFSADLTLIVASVEQARSDIIRTVESAGGYVESSQADFLVVRVPAERFDPILGRIESVGDVRSRQVRTADVTDQFYDLDRRLQISQASRDRLLELLEQTEDPDERVQILRDIRRLTEEIEQLRSSLESLQQLISFSRITVRLISRIQVSSIGQMQIPFPWIRALTPVGVSTRSAEADIEIVPGDEFAVFETGRFVFAEAADGTQIRAGAVTNEPRGDAAFWQRALLFNLSPLYRHAEPVEAGEYRGVLLESRDTRPFSYLILTQDRGNELVVVEVFFPEPPALERRYDQVIQSIAEGQS